MGEKRTMKFNDYIDQLNALNNLNADIALNNNTYPNDKFIKITKKKKKDLIYANTKVRLLNILCKLYKWKIPDNYEERVIELGLIMYGMICLYKSNKGDLLLPCIPYNKYNVYGNPIQVNVHGWNGFHEVVNINYGAEIPVGKDDIIKKEESRAEGIICRDNPLKYPYYKYVQEYAWKLSDKLIALDIATQRLKSPFIYYVNEINLKDNFERMIEKIESNEDIIFKIKNNKLGKFEEAVQSINVNINPAIVQAIKDSINFDFNMFLETIGINTNPSPDKSQVVLTPEIDSNDELVFIEDSVRYDNRKKFCEQAKKILGIKISCERNEREIKKEIEKTRKELRNGNIESNTKETE